MKAEDLKPLARDWLRARYPGADICYELSLAPYGGALVDVAAITEDQIVGVEIKGDGDSASRLKLQGNMYSRACRKVFLLPSSDLYARCEKEKPPEWSMITPPDIDTKHLRWMRQCEVTGIGYRAPKDVIPRGCGTGLAPAALADMIWTTEYATFADHISPGTKLPKKKADFAAFVTHTWPLPWIEEAVCATLREREWIEKKIWKGPRRRPQQDTSNHGTSLTRQ